MANRHAHRKLRAEIHARMAATGESYQHARHRVLSRRVQDAARPAASAVDLVPLIHFGVPMTLATIQDRGIHAFALLAHAPCTAGPRWAAPSLRLLRPRGVN
jgi:hypothetical protein